MPTHTEIASPDEKSERAPLAKPGDPVLASPRRCEVCGTLLTGRPQQKCCSARCRAALSRRKGVPLPLAEAREITANLTLIRDTAGQIAATLERYTR